MKINEEMEVEREQLKTLAVETYSPVCTATEVKQE
jgi:hypothetical protein